jgi:hypothetical protein
MVYINVFSDNTKLIYLLNSHFYIITKMLQIRVSFETITPDQTNAVIDYYNQHKNADWNEIEKNVAAEGGFMIALKPDEIKPDSKNPNDMVKQVRWNRKRLLSGRYGKYLNVFSDDETTLLYDAMVSVFGKELVELANL